MCKHKVIGAILAIVIIVLAWPGLIVWQYSDWALVAIGVLILLKFLIHNCADCCSTNAKPVRAAPVRKARKRKRR